MNTYIINDDSNTAVCDLLKREFSKIKTDIAIANYHPDYSNYPGNFFYILKQGRYKKGNYYILEENNEFICSTGWNEYGLDPEIALLLTRLYIAPKYRSQYPASRYILPSMLDESKNYRHRWVTVNDYNKTFYKMIARLREKPSATPLWPVILKNFKPIGEHKVNGVNQWVVEYDDTSPN